MQFEKDSLIQVKRLSSDDSYYSNVFKKTEKLVSVIFYVLSETKLSPNTETHIQIIKDRALKTHELSLETLMLQRHELHEGLLRFQYGLVALQSTLTIAAVARVIPEDIARLFAEQLDALLRYLSNHYLNKEGVPASELSELAPARVTPRPVSKSSSAPQRQRRVNIPAGDISTDAYLVYSQLTDRAERIKTVLEAKPEATIKDIAEVITDVSEKTIQRELNSLIEKGQVSREGERRWSRYSVVK